MPGCTEAKNLTHRAIPKTQFLATYYGAYKPFPLYTARNIDCLGVVLYVSLFAQIR